MAKGSGKKGPGSGKKGSGKKSKAAAKPSFIERVTNYIKGVRTEMKRVVWPGREEVISSSLIVIVTLVVFSVFVLVIDQISSFVIIDTLAGLGR